MPIDTRKSAGNNDDKPETLSFINVRPKYADGTKGQQLCYIALVKGDSWSEDVHLLLNDDPTRISEILETSFEFAFNLNKKKTKAPTGLPAHLQAKLAELKGEVKAEEEPESDSQATGTDDIPF